MIISQKELTIYYSETSINNGHLSIMDPSQYWEHINSLAKIYAHNKS